MEIRPGVARVAELDLELVRLAAAQSGYVVYVLPASGINDRRSFIEAVKTTLPLDPPLMGSWSWDALADSLWEGLFGLGDRRVAIIWPKAQAMAQAAASDFELAVQVLGGVAEMLADSKATCGRPKELAILLEIPQLAPC